MAFGFVVKRAGLPRLLPAGLQLSLAWHSWAALGGPDEMEVEASGPLAARWDLLRWLGDEIVCVDESGVALWWGYVEAAEVGLGGLSIGLSLAEMSNRVQVVYTFEDGAGDLQDAETDWGEHAASVARYGQRELRQSETDTNETAALKLRDRILETWGAPIGTPSLGEGEGGRLRCRGWWSTLGWKYYGQPAGKEAYEGTGGSLQGVGVGRTSDQFGFGPTPPRLFNVGAGYVPGHTIVVAGSAANDARREVQSLVEQEEWTYTASTISFQPGDDVYDSANGIIGVAPGDVVQVVGSASNDGVYEIKAADEPGHITFQMGDAVMVSEAAGASVTIRRRTYLTTDRGFNQEGPGAMATLTQVGSKVAQAWSLQANLTWEAAEVALRAKKIGAPADSLRVAICADSAGSPGAELAAGTLAGGEIKTGMEWVIVPLAARYGLSYGVTYWLVVSRTGANDDANCYLVDVNESVGYVPGGLKLWDASAGAWIARAPDADMPFVVWGTQETTAQAAAMAQAAGQFMAGVEVVDASGVWTRQYRAGDTKAQEEIEDLLAMGDSGGRRLLGRVTERRRVQFYAQPAANALHDWRVLNDGRIVSSVGEALPAGTTPAGRWLHLAEIPGQVDAVARLSPVFVERATVRADGSVEWEPEGAPSVWALGRVRQG